MADATSVVGVELRLEEYRTELNGYCYRMLGSAFEAEDAVQETMVRAWKAYDRFEGRSALRSWLYRIATNVCMDMLGSAQRRARPMELGPSSKAREITEVVRLPEQVWMGPVPDSRVVPDRSDPAEVAVARDSIRLAFIAALQHLPPKQRAVLILREVLAWSAQETAELLGLTVASVNSALQRARATISSADMAGDRLEPLDKDQGELLTRYVKAFEAYDISSLTTLLHEDATLSMPPIPFWFSGHEDIADFMLGPGAPCRGSRLVPTVANGLPAFGQYRPSGPGGRHEPWALIVLEISGDKIARVNSFLDVDSVFPLFGLPSSLDHLS